ncbi:MAG: hypothetical protein LQ344_002866 [Seirophora lacunosa]|nr:MAG: hypothetical protein LQ344_002866 [Seirophora lacunosa]
MLPRPTHSLLAWRLFRPLPARKSLSNPHAALPRDAPPSLVSCRRYAFNPRRPQYNRFQAASALWRTSPSFRIGVAIGGSGVVVWVASNIEKVPVSGRWRFNCVSEGYEAKLGRMLYELEMEDLQGQLLSPSDLRHKMVGKTLARLVPNSGLHGDWEYHVVDDPDTINAFVLPGGKVFVYSGILPICENEAGLAALLGHEIAHNLCHHVQENASLPYLQSLIVGLVSIFWEDSARLTQQALNYGLELPFSRLQESEADYVGLLLMAQSCYSPEEAVRLSERMEKAGGTTIPQFFSTHPSDKNRIKRLQQWLPEAMQRQSQSDCAETNELSDQFKQALQSHMGQAVPEMVGKEDENDFNWF